MILGFASVPIIPISLADRTNIKMHLLDTERGTQPVTLRISGAVGKFKISIVADQKGSIAAQNIKTFSVRECINCEIVESDKHLILHAADDSKCFRS